MSNALLIPFVIFFIIVIVLGSYLGIYFTTKRKKAIDTKNGFLFLEIDIEKERIKSHNHIFDIKSQPIFLKRLNLQNRKWIKLSKFEAILDKKSLLTFEKALEAKKNLFISFEKKKNRLSKSIIKINIDLNFINEERIFLTLNWKESNYLNKLVFEPINTNISYLITPDNKYFACAFILDMKSITSVNAFIKIFRDICIKNKILGIKIIWDWNKLFFVFPSPKFSKKKAMNSIKTIHDYAQTYKTLFKAFYAFDGILLTKNNSIFAYELIFDYLKSIPLVKEYWLSNEIEKMQSFIQFQKKYTDVSNQLKSNTNIDIKPIFFNDFNDNNTKLNILLIEKKFKNLEIDNFETLSMLDIYKNFFFEFYKNKTETNTQGRILNINDYVFNFIENNDVNELSSNTNSFFQLIKINNIETMARVKKKIEQIQKNNPNLCTAIKLKELDDDIIYLIDKWVKVIWIDENLTAQIKNPAIMLYIRFLIKKAKDLNIAIIFEKLDYKNYKKLIYDHDLKMFYTRSKATKNKVVRKRIFLKGNLWIRNL